MFSLKFEIPDSPLKISTESKICLIGSCFSDEIGKKLHTYKFNCLSNPFGTVYNPVSILKSIRNEIEPSNLTEQDGIFYHRDCHGKISGLNSKEAEKKVTDAVRSLNGFIRNANVLILTFGTAFIYRLKSTNEIVGNCHKIPAASFSKELLSKEEIIDAFLKTHKHIKDIHPDLNIILTVSPVRHTRDGLIESNLSKAVLLQAVHDLTEQFSDVHYFPSYEIIIDELRDYRFYAKDMIHPSEEAIDYVWDRFCETYFDTDTQKFIPEWQSILQALNHKPFHPSSRAHQQFLKNTLEKLENYNRSVDVSKEISELRNQIQ
ncbi:MAG: GSCFA domain-containing protein [Cyclobacteriaceae bacterium]